MRFDKGLRLAVGSFVEDYLNRVQILQRALCMFSLVIPPFDRIYVYNNAVDKLNKKIVVDESLSFTHPFPPTHLAFIPDKTGVRPDLLASSGDALRIWKLSHSGTTMEAMMKDPGLVGANATSAVTSFDWNDLDIKRIVSGSTNGLLSIWDVDTSSISCRLKAHRGEVFDCQWSAVDILASSSSDGTIRIFDLRDQDHCTVLYDSPGKAPIVKLDWNRLDPRFMAFITGDSPMVTILDVRYPKTPAVVLNRHTAPCNAIGWSPNSKGYICTAGDDHQTLIWDARSLAPEESMPNGAEQGIDPVLAYTAEAEISQMCWNVSFPEWLAICCRNKTQILRV